MRIGMAGLAALYWPMALGNGIAADDEVEFLAAATLGEDDSYVRDTLRMLPKEYAEKFGVALYEQAEEMIERERLDAVVLICRHSQHAEWTERLAALGVDIVIPKSFATTAEQAERIVRAGAENGVKIAVTPSARYLPWMLAVKDALDRGLIGDPFALRICHHHGVIDVFHPTDWYRDVAEGGPELSLGWYGVDLILHLLQDSPATVHAEYGNFTSPESPFMDCGRITMRMARGAIASFDMYFCNRVPYPSWQLELVGTKGVISVHRVPGESAGMVVSLDGADGYQNLPVPTPATGWELVWLDEFKRGERPAISAEWARDVTNICLAARDSAERRGLVELQRGSAGQSTLSILSPRLLLGGVGVWDLVPTVRWVC